MATVLLEPASGKVTGTHTDFPVLIQPSLITGLGSLTLAEAQSCRIYTDSGLTVEVAREVVSADEIYVKVPSLTSSSTIYFDYDGIRADYAVTDTYGRNAVWSDYQAVHHLNDTNDSTSNARNLTNNNSLSFASGKIGNAGDGGTTNTNKYLSIVNDLTVGSGSVTQSVWVKINTAPSSGGNQFFSDIGDAGTDVQYQLAYRNNAGTLEVFLNRLRQNVLNQTASYAVDLGTTNWHKLEMTYNGSTATLYLNGTSVASVSASGNGASNVSDHFFLFAVQNGIGTVAFYCPALIDESRVTKLARSSDWISTEYQNQNDNGAFWDATPVGSATPRGAILSFFGMV